MQRLDYYRYIAEFSVEDAKMSVAGNARLAYHEATRMTLALCGATFSHRHGSRSCCRDVSRPAITAPSICEEKTYGYPEQHYPKDTV